MRKTVEDACATLSNVISEIWGGGGGRETKHLFEAKIGGITQKKRMDFILFSNMYSLQSDFS